MQKVTLMFPNHDSLWLFTGKARAINMAITPAKKTIAGLFSSEEVNIAVQEFQAVQIDSSSGSPNPFSLKHTEITTTKPSFRFRFSQLLSLLNL